MKNEKCVVRTRIQILENKVPDLSWAWFSKVTNHIPVLQRHSKAISKGIRDMHDFWF